MLKASTAHKLIALITSGHIALCPQGLSASKNINVLHSIPDKRTNYRVNSYLTAQNSSREKVVVVSGFGIDADSATLNAAENALNQLVGSIVTSDTLVKKKTEIRNGIVDQVKTIKKDITDYSQGVIKRIDILEAKKENGVFVVTIKAKVRIDDFKKFIKNLAKSEQKIEPGIFSTIRTNYSNRASKLKLLVNTLEAIINGEAQEIKIRKPLLFDERFDIYVPSYWDKQNTIVIPVDVSLRSEFYNKLVDRVESLSSQKMKELVPRKKYTSNYSFHLKMRNDFGNSEESTAFYVDISNNSNGSWMSQKYYLPGMRSGNTSLTDLMPYKKNRYADIKISFLDSFGSPVSQVIFHGDAHGFNEIKSGKMRVNISRPNSFGSLRIPTPVKGATCHEYTFALASIRGRSTCIHSTLRFFIYAEIPPSLMQSIDNISVEFVH